MKLYGLSNMLAQSEEVDSILKELECEMMGGLRLPAHQRLLMCTLSSAMVIDGMNKKSEMLNNFSQEKLNDDVVKKYEDL